MLTEITAAKRGVGGRGALDEVLRAELEADLVKRWKFFRDFWRFVVLEFPFFS